MLTTASNRPLAIPSGTMVMEADRRLPSATVRLCHLDLVRSRQHILHATNAYRVDLCLTPRLALKMRFERWASGRYVQPGRLFVVPPGETAAVWNEVGQESVLVCYLHPRYTSQRDEARVAPSYLDISSDIVSNEIEQLMLKLRQEVSAPSYASELMIEGLALQLSAELQRYYRRPSLDVVSGGLNAWRLQKIDTRLQALDNPATLPELAALCGLSVRQLSRGFRVSRGVSLGRYIARQRIDSAKLALAAGESIKRVASHMGFCSSAAFASAFRKTTGCTPSDFRQLSLRSDVSV